MNGLLIFLGCCLVIYFWAAFAGIKKWQHPVLYKSLLVLHFVFFALVLLLYWMSHSRLYLAGEWSQIILIWTWYGSAVVLCGYTDSLSKNKILKGYFLFYFFMPFFTPILLLFAPTWIFLFYFLIIPDNRATINAGPINDKYRFEWVQIDDLFDEYCSVRILEEHYYFFEKEVARIDHARCDISQLKWQQEGNRMELITIFQDESADTTVMSLPAP